MDKLTFYINKVAIDDNGDLSLPNLPVAASVQAWRPSFNHYVKNFDIYPQGPNPSFTNPKRLEGV